MLGYLLLKVNHPSVERSKIAVTVINEAASAYHDISRIACRPYRISAQGESGNFDRFNLLEKGGGRGHSPDFSNEPIPVFWNQTNHKAKMCQLKYSKLPHGP